MALDKEQFLPAKRLLEFRADNEPWTQYTLENGAIIRMRVVVTKIEDAGERSADGIPRYMIQAQQLIDFTPTEEMRADAEAWLKSQERNVGP